MGVESADVVPAHVPDALVDGEYFAVVPPLVARAAVEQAGADEGEEERVQMLHLRQTAETRILIRVAPCVDDHVRVDSALRRFNEGVAELRARLIGFDDEPFEENAVLGGADVGQHGVVKLAAVGEDRHRVWPDLRVLGRKVGETARLGRPLFPHGVNDADSGDCGGLRGNRSQSPPFGGGKDMALLGATEFSHGPTV